MDYERLCASGEALVYAAMIRLMMRRLARTWALFIQPQKGSSAKFICTILHKLCPSGQVLLSSPVPMHPSQHYMLGRWIEMRDLVSFSGLGAADNKLAQ
jgi:hypothetical protein